MDVRLVILFIARLIFTDRIKTRGNFISGLRWVKGYVCISFVLLPKVHRPLLLLTATKAEYAHYYVIKWPLKRLAR